MNLKQRRRWRRCILQLTVNDMVSNHDDGTDRSNEHSNEDASPTTPGGEMAPSSSEHDGADSARSADTDAASVDDVDPNRTFVPSQTPTYQGSDSSVRQKNEEAGNPNRTFVPSETPTADGLDRGLEDNNTSAAASDEDDFNSTVVMGDRPAADDSEPVPSAADDFESTVVMGDRPAADDSVKAGFDTVVMPQGGEETGESGGDNFDMTVVMGDLPPEDDSMKAGTESDTVVMPPGDLPSASDSAVAGGVESGTEQTQVFSRTMGMRGLTEDEYDEWQQDVAAKSVSDTDPGPMNELPDTGDSALGKRTQIWSKQSGDGLDFSLNVCSRPVAGDDQFGSRSGSGKPDYDVVEKLAEGGMGAIYVAKQTSLDRELAIKTLKPLKDREKKNYESQGRMSQVDKQRREMFLSEALVTSNLVHPHIIPIHDLCQTVDGSPFYSMKLVNGTPWNERIVEMSQEDNLEVLHKVCDAMAYAHHNGVVNRDLKPENIMLGEFGEVLVLDWGLAVPALEADKNRFTSPSASFGAGTPAYMSPELWTGPPDAIGTWSDIYLLGAILYEVITTKAPHTFPDPDSSAGRSGLWVVIDNVVRTNQIRETSATGELMDIAAKAMSTDPKGRHRTVLEFQEEIKNFQNHEESRRLADRATQTLSEVGANGGNRGYQDYQTAAALFDEAHVAWPENKHARNGLRETRLAYAELAHENGDYDLGLQIAEQEQGPDFTELAGKLTRARRFRNGLKYGTIAAVLITVLFGSFSFLQWRQITALVGTKATLEGEVKDAENKRKDAEYKATLADQKVAAADQELKAATIKVADADAKLVAAKVRLSDANTKVAESTAAVAVLEQQKTLLDADKKRLTKERVRAEVELRNLSIASLIRSADYAAALQRVEELLTALDEEPALADLPDIEKKQRIEELKARQRQLMKRALPNKVPVQSQVISPSGRIVVWGDREGWLVVWQLELEADELPEKPLLRISLGAPVSRVCIGKDDDLIAAAAGHTLHLYRLSDREHTKIEGHDQDVTAVELGNGYLLSADSGGSIRAWDLKSLQQRWSIRSSSDIRDLAILQTEGCFLYAGSRGGESSDVLAYRLPPDSSPEERPQRLGQLRFPRNRNFPPKRIAVSPDESLLLISNSRNGDVLLLPRAAMTDQSGRNQFPFIHAADLDLSAVTGSPLADRRHQRPVNSIDFSADGKRVVTASDDRSVGVWDVSPGGDSSSGSVAMTLLHRLEGHGARVNAAGFLNAAGTRVLSASSDRYCRIWNVLEYKDDRRAIEAAFDLARTSAVPHFFPGDLLPSMIPGSRNDVPGPGAENLTVAVRTPDDLSFAQGDGLSSSRYFLTAARPRRDLSKVHADDSAPDYVVLNANGFIQRGALNSVELSFDGTRAVTGASDGTAVIWDTKTGRPVTGASSRSRFAPKSGSFEEGHHSNVSRLRFLPPDGKVLLTTGFDGNLCLWRSDLGKSGVGAQQVRVQGLGLVNAIAASPDGQFIVTSAAADDDRRVGQAVIWRTRDLLESSQPQPTATLQGFHRGEVSAVAVGPDGKKIVTGASDGRVAFWSADSGQLIAGDRIHAKNTIVSHLEWVTDDSVLSTGFDGRLLTVKVVNDFGRQGTGSAESQDALTSMQVVGSYKHDRIPIERVCFSPECDQFVTVSVRTDKAQKTTSYEMQLWNTGDLNAVRNIQPATVQDLPPQRIATVDWSPDGRRLAAVVDGNLQVFSTATWRVQKVLEAPGLGISDAVFAPQSVATSANEQITSTPETGLSDVIATFDGTAAHLWDLENYTHLADFRPLFAVQSTALSVGPDQPLLLTGDRAVRIFQADADSPGYGHTLSKISDPHRGVVTSLSFARGNRFFVSSGADGSAALWEWKADISESRLVRWLRTEGAAVVHVAWSSDGADILLVCADGCVSVLSAEDSEQNSVDITISAAGPLRLECGDYAADGRSIAVGGQLTESGASIGWIYTLDDDDSIPPQLHCKINGHDAGGIRTLAFLPDSPYVVTGGADGAAIAWNWQPQRTQTPGLQAYEAYQFLVDGDVRAHRAPINSLAVSSAGNIATASDDGTSIVWKNPFRQ
ncbi:MAG: protein kinase [Fuerstiella sp.]|nr:protein kinase [Fuerstiella sp.]